MLLPTVCAKVQLDVTNSTEKRVFLPRIVGATEQRYPGHKKDLVMIEVHSQDIPKLSPKGPYGLREPELGPDGKQLLILRLLLIVLAFDANGLDMIVLPGVGFTSDCLRLGHGKGFYDTYIARHEDWSKEHNQPRPFLVAVGAQEQLLEELPSEEHDYKVDAVIIDWQIFRKQ